MSTLQLKVTCTRDCGRMITVMDEVFIFGLMGKSTRETIPKVFVKVKGKSVVKIGSFF